MFNQFQQNQPFGQFQQNQLFGQFQPVPYTGQPFNNYYQPGVPVCNNQLTQFQPQFNDQFQPQPQTELEDNNFKLMRQLEEEVQELKTNFNSFVKKSEVEKVSLTKIIEKQSYKINELIDISNELMKIFKKVKPANIVEAVVVNSVQQPVQPVQQPIQPPVQPVVTPVQQPIQPVVTPVQPPVQPVVTPVQPVENLLKRKRQNNDGDVENGIQSASWLVDVEPTASYNKRAMLSSEELVRIQLEMNDDTDVEEVQPKVNANKELVKPIIISSTEVTEEEVVDVDDLTKEEISKMVDNAISSYISQQMPVSENKYFINFNDKNISFSQKKIISKSTGHDIVEISVVSSNSLTSVGNEDKKVKYILIRQVFKPLISSEANLNSTILRAKLTYGIEYMKTHIHGYHNNRLIMNYTGLYKMLEYIKQNKPSLLNTNYGQSLFELVEELK
jgi:hypothetical protein